MGELRSTFHAGQPLPRLITEPDGLAEQRPVPRFLFLDQPSQVYFPAERDLGDSTAVLPDDDRIAFARMLKLVIDVVEDLAPEFQVVITEHTELAEEWYRSAVVERWREGRALVPQDIGMRAGPVAKMRRPVPTADGKGWLRVLGCMSAKPAPSISFAAPPTPPAPREDLEAAEADEVHRLALADGSFDADERVAHDGFDHGFWLSGVGRDAFDQVSEKHDALLLNPFVAPVAPRGDQGN